MGDLETRALHFDRQPAELARLARLGGREAEHVEVAAGGEDVAQGGGHVVHFLQEHPARALGEVGERVTAPARRHAGGLRHVGTRGETPHVDRVNHRVGRAQAAEELLEATPSRGVAEVAIAAHLPQPPLGHRGRVGLAFGAVRAGHHALIEARGEEHDLLAALDRVEQARQALEAPHVGPHATSVDLLLGALQQVERVAVDPPAAHDYEAGLGFLDLHPQVPGQRQGIAQPLASSHAKGGHRLAELRPIRGEAHQDVRASGTEHGHRHQVPGTEPLLQKLQRGRPRLVEAAGGGEAQVEEKQELPARRRLDRGGPGGGKDCLCGACIHRFEGHDTHPLAGVLDLEVCSIEPRHRLALLVRDEDRHRDHGRLGPEDRKGGSGPRRPLLGGR